MSDYPDSPPSRGWPADHARRLDGLEAAQQRVALQVAAGAAIGTALPHYLRPEILEQVKAFAAQYPGAALALGLLVVLGGAKVPPPADPRWRGVWEFWARWVAQTRWDQWGGWPKRPGTIVPEPPPLALEAPPAADEPPPTLRGGGAP